MKKILKYTVIASGALLGLFILVAIFSTSDQTTQPPISNPVLKNVTQESQPEPETKVQPESVPQQTPEPQPKPEPDPIPQPKPEPTWRTIATFSGSSSKNTQPFSVTGNQIRLTWSCGLTGEFDSGSFSINIKQTTEKYGDLLINTGNCPLADTTYFYEGQNTYFLEVGGIFTNWTITVEDLY